MSVTCGAETREVARLFHRGVAAADDRHRLAAEERTVADRARRDALVLQLVFVRAGRGNWRARRSR